MKFHPPSLYFLPKFGVNATDFRFEVRSDSIQRVLQRFRELLNPLLLGTLEQFRRLFRLCLGKSNLRQIPVVLLLRRDGHRSFRQSGCNVFQVAVWAAAGFCSRTEPGMAHVGPHLDSGTKACACGSDAGAAAACDA